MKVFISYNYTTEQAFVSKLSIRLRDAGIIPWTVNLQSGYGSDIIEHIDEVIANCNYILIVLSKSYVESTWLQKELFAFLMKESHFQNKFLIPILVEDCDYHPFLEGRICDFTNKEFEKAFEQLTLHFSSEKKVFVVMKFGNAELDSVFELAIKPVIEQCGYQPIRIEQVQDSRIITEEILRYIRLSDMVVADLTYQQPDSYYLVGYAQGLDKELVLTIRKGDDIQIDLSGNRFMVWQTANDLKGKLYRRINEIKEKQQMQLSKFKSPFVQENENLE